MGVGFIALAILLKFLNLQHDASNFIQGFSVGLGLVLMVKGFLATKKREEQVGSNWF